jgi:hypothetical protein
MTTDKQKDRQTGRQADIKTDRQTKIQIYSSAPNFIYFHTVAIS